MAEKKSLIKKTDSAVKTAEAWTAFATILWEAKGFFAPVVVLAGAMIAAFLDIFTLGWGYGVFAGIGMLVLASIIWLIVSWLWYLRPGAKEKREQRSLAPSSNTGVTPFKSDQFTISTKQQVKNEVSYFKTLANQKIKEMKDELEREFKILKEDNNKGIDALFANKKLSDDLKFGEIAEIQDARAALYILDPLTKKIQDEAMELFEIPLIDSWNYRFGHWVQDLRNWDSFSTRYATDTYKPLFNIDPDMLRSEEWDDKVNAMEHNDALEYKKFRLYRSAFNSNESKMLKRIRALANRPFVGRGASSEYLSRFSD